MPIGTHKRSRGIVYFIFLILFIGFITLFYLNKSEVSAVHLGPYAVQLVADNDAGSPFFDFTRPALIAPSMWTVPSINETGKIAFFARLKSGGEGIFLSDAGSISTVADTSSGLSEFGPGPSVNGSDQVAFVARNSDSSQAVFRGCVGCLPATIALTGAGFTDFSYWPHINDSGQVFFAANQIGPLTEACRWSVLGSGDGGPVTVVADTTGQYACFSSQNVNSGGQVSFRANLDDGRQGIFVIIGGMTKTAILVDPLDSNDPFERLGAWHALSDDLSIAADAGFKGGGDAAIKLVYDSSTDSYSTVVEMDTRNSQFDRLRNGGVLSDEAGGPSWRAAPVSLVAGCPNPSQFVAILDSGESGVFAISAGEIVTVSFEGDAIAGSLMADLFTEGSRAVNSRGQSTFWNRLGDGREGVFMADPGPCPIETLVTLASFVAHVKDGTLNLEWTTGAEIDHEGFNVLRSEVKEDSYTRLNETLIPAKGVPPSGASYTFLDATAKQGVTYFYKLEDVDNKGVKTQNGPLEITVVDGNTAALDISAEIKGAFNVSDASSESSGSFGCGFIKPDGRSIPPSSGNMAGTLLVLSFPFVWVLLRRAWRHRRNIDRDSVSHPFAR